MSAVEEEKKKDETEILEPNYAVRYQVIGKGEHLHTYAQRPLSFFGKMELFSLLGATLNEAVSKGDFSITEFMQENQEIRDSEVFIRIVARLIEFAPDFLKDLYSIALAIPKGEREYVKALMELPEDEGGLSDNDGVEILDVFVEQNWDAMTDFFVQKILPFSQKVSSRVQNTQLSKPLNRTQRRTQKQ